MRRFLFIIVLALRLPSASGQEESNAIATQQSFHTLSSDPLNIMPKELIPVIVGYVSDKNTLIMRLVCKRWKQHIDQILCERNRRFSPDQLIFPYGSLSLIRCNLSTSLRALLQASRLGEVKDKNSVKPWCIAERLQNPLPLTLQHLDISGHVFAATLPTFAVATNLTKLIMAKNNLGAHGKLINQISLPTSLRFLDLSETGIRRLPQTFTNLMHLETLSLQGNAQNIFVISRTPLNLHFIPRMLRNLDLSSNGLSNVPQALSVLTQLNSLNMGNNYLGNADENSWRNLPISLVDLTLDYSIFGQKRQGKVLTKVPAFFASLTNLKVLNISGHSLGVDGDEVGASFPDSLTALNLSWNKIKKLSSDFTKLTNLKILDLTLAIKEKLAEGLQSNLPESLAELKLGLGKVSIDLIFPLTALSRLTKLNLAHNSWGTIAGQLDQVLPRSLCELDLSNGKWNCPPIMTQLTNLTNLRLAESTWTMQPDKQSQHIVLPTSLKVLDCFESTLLESWETLANLTCLTRLNISQGWSRMLEEQGYDKFPTSLQALYLGMMPQSFSPSQLTYLTRLTKLSFKNEAKLW